MKRGLVLFVSWVSLVAACSSGSGGASGSGSGGAGGSGATTAGSGGVAGQTTAGTGGETVGSGGQPDAGMAAGSGGAPADIDASTMTDAGADIAVSSAWPPVTDYAAAGPFATMRTNNTGPGNGYDIFRPVDLGAGGRKHPIISWNNGTLYAIDLYKDLLDHWASYGFVVIGAHTNTTAGGGVHKAAIDWLVAQNGAAASPFHNVLDLTKIGASGHSQGGGATLAAAANKPGTTGIVASLPLMPILSFEADASILGKQTAPLLLISATMDDRSTMVADQTLAAVTSPFVTAAFKGVHEDAMSAAMHAPALAWFRFQLMDDQNARSFFYPPTTCGLCTDPTWMAVRYKNTP
ncbi:MAG TPA: hypothetical protein VH374_03475 [Polyangia bacterium]|jgi:hypothetical protein|nr:hypothetical protein [Polyangia bacterium]